MNSLILPIINFSTMPVCPGRKGKIASEAERPIHRDPEGYLTRLEKHCGLEDDGHAHDSRPQLSRELDAKVCVPKIAFVNIGGEAHRELAVKSLRRGPRSPGVKTEGNQRYSWLKTNALRYPIFMTNMCRRMHRSLPRLENVRI